MIVHQPETLAQAQYLWLEAWHRPPPISCGSASTCQKLECLPCSRCHKQVEILLLG